MSLSVDRSPVPIPNFFSCYCGIAHLTEPSSTGQKIRSVSFTLILLIVLFGFEWGIALWSHSLSVQADAGHLVFDMVAVAITLFALWLGERPAVGRATFGHQRLEILAALVNGVGLLLVAAAIAVESWERLNHPHDVLSLPMVAGGTLGLVVNSINLWILRQNSRHDLNLRAAFLHTLSDVASSVGIIIASLSIHLWQFLWMDTLTGFLVAGFTAISAVPLIIDSLRIFLEYAPKTIDPEAVEQRLLDTPEVESIKSLKIWQISTYQTALCSHIQVSNSLESASRDRLLKSIEKDLKSEFSIQEITLQVTSLGTLDPLVLHPLFQRSLIDIVI